MWPKLGDGVYLASFVYPRSSDNGEMFLTIAFMDGCNYTPTGHNSDLHVCYRLTAGEPVERHRHYKSRSKHILSSKKRER